jgi:serine/threonine-protein kinase
VVAPVQPVATDAAPGFLTLNTTPWSKVSIDGEPVGSTPIFKKKLSAGAHTLVLVNEGASIQKSQTVTIKPGETNKLSLTLAP